MGRTIETVLIENFGDFYNWKNGTIPKKNIRKSKVDALVDTGAAYLCLPL
ncbi:MAG: hypothetical protein HW421_1041 [Ignavibacteria bacterium]|nr:hypothetical protein [Ignavibacteria bacterium]